MIRGGRVFGKVLVWVAISTGWSCGMEGRDPSDDSGETMQTILADERVISEADPNFRRFELPEEEGECAMAQDCVPAGCSAEVCTTVSEAPELYTYCAEKHPGTQYYCTCLATRCRWVEDPEFNQ